MFFATLVNLFLAQGGKKMFSYSLVNSFLLFEDSSILASDFLGL